MLDLVLLGFIDKRLRQAKEKLNEFFGGVSVLLVGGINVINVLDPAQLPPVTGTALYSEARRNEDKKIHGKSVYLAFDKVINLMVNLRTQDDGILLTLKR